MKSLQQKNVGNIKKRRVLRNGRSQHSTAKKIIIQYMLVGILYLVLDQILKYIARLNPNYKFYFFEKRIGFEYFENSGIAFSLPFPNDLLIIIAPFVIIILSVIFTKYRCNYGLLACFKKKFSNRFVYGLLLVIFGAISNLIDRIFFEFTTDYLHFFSLVINVADIMIICGVLLLLLPKRRVE